MKGLITNIANDGDKMDIKNKNLTFNIYEKDRHKLSDLSRGSLTSFLDSFSSYNFLLIIFILVI